MRLLGNYRCSVKNPFVLFWINVFCFLQCAGGANKKYVTIEQNPLHLKQCCLACRRLCLMKLKKENYSQPKALAPSTAASLPLSAEISNLVLFLYINRTFSS